MLINQIETAIDELEKKIDEQREINVNLFKTIPIATREDPNNEKAKPILKQWRDGSKKIKELIAELNKLKDARREASPPTAEKQHKTFVNGFGEATTREISCAAYRRAERRRDKEILSFMGKH